MKKDAPKKKTGLREIAALAKVSVTTASRVLNGNNRVDPAIQQKVLQAAAKLDVDLSKRNKTKALAFLLSNRAMLHAFHSRVLKGAEACCAAHGWDMVFLSFSYSPHMPWQELYLPKVVQRRDMVRAVILAGTNSSNLLELLEHRGIPSVVLGNNLIGEPKKARYDVIFSDETQGSHNMTRYLIQLGHRRIGFVGNLQLPWFSRGFIGYQKAMERAGLRPAHSSIDSEDDTEIGYLGTKFLLASNEPPTAIFAGNDQTAYGVYKAVRDSGLKIPDDISVAGCDDTIGAWLYPGLTTIREFPEHMGKQMVEMAIKRISDPSLPPQSVTVPTEFIQRESCRAISDPDATALEEALQRVTIG
ncbi:catabolite control protein A [Acidisarcina polymorpha]|uniref:Catabolite control protein A n=2 Tax=Acidisarcina polymorpha TaxID=2211140 RepID=A0A2Z5G1W9_9BACT|nr:catabolite control protein A [Acidisarcina polymorpha]